MKSFLSKFEQLREIRYFHGVLEVSGFLPTSLPSSTSMAPFSVCGEHSLLSWERCCEGRSLFNGVELSRKSLLSLDGHFLTLEL